jgi:LPXTG-motif cell wall-anchored protein
MTGARAGDRPRLRRRLEPPGNGARARPPATGEEGQILILLVGLVGLILMVLGLGWDASNWFLGHRALDNLADGAAIAAASDVDLRAFYASDGLQITISDERALATVRQYLLDVAGDSGLQRVAPGSVRVERAANGPRVTVELRAATPAAFLRYLHVVAPEMVGSATATAELREP